MARRSFVLLEEAGFGGPLILSKLLPEWEHTKPVALIISEHPKVVR